MVWVTAAVAIVGTAYGAYQTNKANKAAAAAERQRAFAEARANGYNRLAAYAKASQTVDQSVAVLRESALQAAISRQEAREIKQAALDHADQIKRAAMQQRGEIIVAQSASGTMIGEGSAQASIDQLDALSSADALVAIYSGVNAAASKRFQAKLIEEAGKERAKGLLAEAGSQQLAGDAYADMPTTLGSYRPSPWASAAIDIAGSVAGGYAKSSGNKTKTE